MKRLVAISAVVIAVAAVIGVWYSRRMIPDEQAACVNAISGAGSNRSLTGGPGRFVVRSDLGRYSSLIRNPLRVTVF